MITPLPQNTAPQSLVLTRTAQVSVPLTVTASSAYTANNSVGGLIRFSSITGPQQSGVVQNLTVQCKSAQTTGYKLYLFNDNPSNTTIADKATPTLSAVDLPKLLDVITLGSSDSTLGPTLNVTDNIGRAFTAPSTTLYAILITTSTPTYSLASDVSIVLSVMQD